MTRLMGAYQKFDLGLAASALEWWHDAGVDTLVDDDPRDWFAAPEASPANAPAGRVAEPTIAPVMAAPTALPGTLPDTFPDTFEAFAAWRSGPQAPEAGWSGITLAASGPVQAPIMVMVDCPDREDGDAGALLSGSAGRLFDRMLAAIGLSRDVVHLAAVCARRPAAGRMPRDVEARLGEVSRHHVALVAPERLLLLGNAASRAVLGTEMLATRGSLRPFNHKNGQTGVVATHHPRLLIERPAMKAETWRDLQMLIGGMRA